MEPVTPYTAVGAPIDDVQISTDIYAFACFDPVPIKQLRIAFCFLKENHWLLAENHSIGAA